MFCRVLYFCAFALPCSPYAPYALRISRTRLLSLSFVCVFSVRRCRCHREHRGQRV